MMTTEKKRALLKGAFVLGLLLLLTTFGLALVWRSEVAMGQLLFLASCSGVGLMLVVLGKVGLIMVPKDEP